MNGSASLVRVRRFFFGASCVALAACAGITGLGDYEIFDPVDGGGANEAGHGEGGVELVPGGVSVSVADFADGVCGTATTRTLTITNENGDPVPYQLTLPPNDTFTLDGPASGMVPALGTTSVGIRALRNVSGKGEVDLDVRTNGGSMPIHLAFTTHGPHVSFVPAAIDLGKVNAKGGPALMNLRFGNDGDREASVTGLSSGEIVWKPPVTVPPSTVVELPVDIGAGTAGQAINAKITAAVAGNCGGDPALTLTGQRTNDEITLTPASIDLGAVDCNADGASGRVRLSSYGGGTSFSTNSGHFSSSPTSGGLAAATNGVPNGVDFMLKAKGGDTPGDYTDDFVVSDVNTGSSVSTKVHVEVHGARLALGSRSIKFQGSTPATTTITNSGDVTVCVSYTPDQPGFQTLAADSELPPNAAKVISVTGATDASTPMRRVRYTIAAIPCPGQAKAAALCKTPDPLDVDGH